MTGIQNTYKDGPPNFENDPLNQYHRDQMDPNLSKSRENPATYAVPTHVEFKVLFIEFQIPDYHTNVCQYFFCISVKKNRKSTNVSCFFGGFFILFH